jgi:hypothetical protein
MQHAATRSGLQFRRRWPADLVTGPEKGPPRYATGRLRGNARRQPDGGRAPHRHPTPGALPIAINQLPIAINQKRAALPAGERQRAASFGKLVSERVGSRLWQAAVVNLPRLRHECQRAPSKESRPGMRRGGEWLGFTSLGSPPGGRLPPSPYCEPTPATSAHTASAIAPQTSSAIPHHAISMSDPAKSRPVRRLMASASAATPASASAAPCVPSASLDTIHNSHAAAPRTAASGGRAQPGDDPPPGAVAALRGCLRSLRADDRPARISRRPYLSWRHGQTH